MGMGLKMSPRRILLYGAFAAGVLALAATGWAGMSLRNTSVTRLAACMETESGWEGRICRQAVYWLHPTAEEVRHLNAVAGALFPAQLSDAAEARRLMAHFLAAGVDVNSADQRVPTRWTALHIAVLEPNPTAVEILLDFGARPDVRDAHGKTALEAAREAQQQRPTADYSKVIALLEAAHP